MTIKRVLYQTVFATPQPPAFTSAPQSIEPQVTRYLATAATVALMGFSAWHSPFFGTKTPITPEWTEFDHPRAPQFSASDQQFSAWHSPFFGTKTPITPDWTAFDQARAPQYQAAEQQFSAFFSPPPPAPPPPSAGIVDHPVTVKRQVLYQSEFKAPFVQPPPVTLIKAFTSTPFDQPQAPQVKAAEQQFTAYNGTAPVAVVTNVNSGGIFEAPLVIRRNVLYQSEFRLPEKIFAVVPAGSEPTLFDTLLTIRRTVLYQSEFNTPLNVQQPTGPPGYPFDIPVQENHPEGHYQFSAFEGLFTPPQPTLTGPLPSTPFDAPRAPQYAAGEQQFTSWHSPFPKFTQTPAFLSQFYVDTTIPKLTVPPALLQFNDLPMGPEQTIAPPEEVVLGRWGPDETKEERRRRHKAGVFFQWEEMPDRSEFAPDPVEHPPHEPQKWADEPAAVRTGAKASPLSGVEHLAAVLADVPDDTWEDPEIVSLVEELVKNGWRR